MKSVIEIIDYLNPIETYIGSKHAVINEIIKANITNSRDDVAFWVSEKYLSTLSIYKAGTILCPSFPESSKNSKCNFLIFENPRKAFQQLLSFLYPDDFISCISKTACINITTKLSRKVSIGEHVVIEENCVLGDRVKIGHNTVIKSNTIIGNDVTIGCNNTIGGIGFGYEKNELGVFQSIKHIGGVIICDGVDIGNNNCIDKAVLENTIIGKGSKIDNLVHIAHNVVIGDNCTIIANAMVGGSCNIENNSWIAPSSCLKEGINIGANVTVGLGAVVIKNIPENEVWAGNPAKILKRN